MGEIADMMLEGLLDVEMNKRCSKCGVHKALTAFANPDGDPYRTCARCRKVMRLSRGQKRVLREWSGFDGALRLMPLPPNETPPWEAL